MKVAPPAWFGEEAEAGQGLPMRDARLHGIARVELMKPVNLGFRK